MSTDEPAGGYMEMLEYRKSARGYVMALKDKGAMEGYLIHPIHDSANFSARIEYLCQDAERR